MNTGLAILLSSIFIGLIILYISTKDSWSWKKILIRLTISIFIITFTVIIGIIVYSEIKDRPRHAAEFWDISLGASKADVKFLKGKPKGYINQNTWIYINTIFDTG